ncbi:site-specific DNA-methyltransferase [Roseivirga sp. BDSF3-8]|uniref:DNA-methyltransferase n=1 Tax=Roseivirga sp. BDSF3-8 TaxID=3241598 RepID=UPI003531C1A7
MELNKIIKGDSVQSLANFEESLIDLIYFDPPFFTQKTHSLRKGKDKLYKFDDKFNSLEEYLSLIENVLVQSKRVLKPTGSVFLHCDKTASHHIRVILDKVFGHNNFQSEIVWTYRRWSNSKKGLLNSHQIIFFYSKTNNFKFNPIFTNYSPTTNIDQILQDRERDKFGKSVYKRDSQGNIVLGKEKRGVPLSDVWEIPYLNPKAKERTGYPTQKPVLLLNRIIELVTDEGDLVVDPFCGSGTTCVSAKNLNRNYLGIDQSCDAVELAKCRLDDMVITQSNLLKNGEESYIEKSEKDLAILQTIGAVPVQRNSGIDGFLKEQIDGKPVPIKIQGKHDSLDDSIEKIEKASRGKGYDLKIVIQTREAGVRRLFGINSNVEIIKSLDLLTKEKLNSHFKKTDDFEKNSN